MKGRILALCALFCAVCLVAFGWEEPRWSNSNDDLARDLDRAKDRVRELEGAVEKLKEDAQQEASRAFLATIDDSVNLEDEVKRLQAQVSQLQRDTLELRVMLATRLGPPAPAGVAAAKAPPGTALRFHQDMVAKAAALGLTDRLVPDPKRQQALKAFDKWTVDEKLLGREVEWTLVLAEARDTRSSGDVEALNLKWEQLRQQLIVAEGLLIRLRARKVARGFSASDKRKAIQAKEREIKDLKQQQTDLSKELVEAKLYWIKVTALPVGQPQVRISASVYGDDLNLVAGVPVGGTFRLWGYVGRIRCERDRFGKTEFPMELVRCRATKP